MSPCRKGVLSCVSERHARIEIHIADTSRVLLAQQSLPTLTYPANVFLAFFNKPVAFCDQAVDPVLFCRVFVIKLCIRGQKPLSDLYSMINPDHLVKIKNQPAKTAIKTCPKARISLAKGNYLGI
jgi:hypothetical protein